MTSVLTAKSETIFRIQLDRADKKNALTLAMYDALTEALQQADADPDVRVIVLTGAGDSFSAGNDLHDFLQNPPSGADSPPMRFLAVIASTRKPIVAAVNGIAIGIGTTLLLHCDLVYAAKTARFHLPFVNLALVPEAGSSYILPRLLGHQRAAELLLGGEAFGADAAYRAGIVNAVVPDDELENHVAAVAASLAAKPPSALSQTKALMKRGTSAAVADAMNTEGETFVKRLQSDEAREAMQAFLERRAPDFSPFTGE